MTHYTRVLALHIAVLMCSTAMTFANDWTAWRGPNGDGTTDETGWNPMALEGRLKVDWQKSIGVGYSAVAVRGDRLYAIGNRLIKKGEKREGIDTVYCLESATGKEIWRFSYPCTSDTSYPGPTASPVLDGDRLYTLSDDTGDLFCFDANSGAVKWKINVVSEFGAQPPHDGFGYSSSPVIEGDALLLNINTKGIAVNKLTGKTIWASPSGPCSYSSPVVFDHDGKRKMALFGAKKLFILDIATGNELGSFDWDTFGNENAADPLIIPKQASKADQSHQGDRVFISSGYDTGCALLQLTDSHPERLWQNHNMENLFTSSVFHESYIYGIDGMRRRNALKCIDSKTGEVKWSEKMDFGSLILAGDTLIVLNERGMLRIVKAEPESYQEISSAKIMASTGTSGDDMRKKRVYWWTNPVLANGKLYLRSDNGDLMCLDLRDHS